MIDNLSVVTKRKVYQACVLSVLLGGEYWTPLKRHTVLASYIYFIINMCVLYWESLKDNSGKNTSLHTMSERVGVYFNKVNEMSP